MDSELVSSMRAQPHPALPTLAPARFSAAMTIELARLQHGKAATPGIDLARYESVSEPGESGTAAAAGAEWRAALQQAYATHTYLSGRLVNLTLLDQFGKNQWLIGNAALEDLLRHVERELKEVRARLEEVDRQRKEQQEGVLGEFLTLDDAWKSNIERMIATEAAAEGLRLQILQHKRQAATS